MRTLLGDGPYPYVLSHTSVHTSTLENVNSSFTTAAGIAKLNANLDGEQMAIVVVEEIFQIQEDHGSVASLFVVSQQLKDSRY